MKPAEFNRLLGILKDLQQLLTLRGPENWEVTLEEYSQHLLLRITIPKEK